MTRALVVFPDVETDAVEWLRFALLERSEDYAQDVEVHSRTPETRPTRLVTVVRAGGVGDYLLDRPRLAVTVWHETAVEARDLATLVRALLQQMRGFRAFRGIRESSGLVSAPDIDGTPRYLLTIETTVKGASI